MVDSLRPIDPTDVASVRPGPITREPPQFLLEKWNLVPPDSATQWLAEHTKNIEKDSYVDLDEEGQLRLREGLEVLYPGAVKLIRAARLHGIAEDEIYREIHRTVGKALDAGISSEFLEDKLFNDPTQMSTIRRAKEYIKHTILPEQVSNYLSWPIKDKKYRHDVERVANEAEKSALQEKYMQDRLMFWNEVTGVVGKMFSAVTFGMGPVAYKPLFGEMPTPQTVPGVIGGAGASLAGFILGPYKAASGLLGTAKVPTASGLRAVAGMMADGGAKLGAATMLSDIVPALEQSDDLLDAAVKIGDATATGTLIGTLFPLSGAIESKPVRLAVGFAVLDKIRAGRGQWSTVDDVYRGLSDGTIDKNELAEQAFGYMLDMYFLNKVPSMKAEMQLRYKNRLAEDLIKTNPDEVEEFIVRLGRNGLVPGTDTAKIDGLNRDDIVRQFGGMDGFRRAFRSYSTELADRVGSAIRSEAEKVGIHAEGAAAVAAPEQKGVTHVPEVQAEGGKEGQIARETPLPLKPSQSEPTVSAENRTGSVKEATGTAGGQGVTLDQVIDFLKVQQTYNETNMILRQLSKGDYKAALREVARLGWDASANVKAALLKLSGDEGKEAVIRKDLIAGAPERAWLRYQAAAGDIYGDLSKADHIMLDKIIQSRRNVAIGKYKQDFVFTDGRTAQEHQSFLDTQRSIDPEKFSDLNGRADRYFAVMRGSIDRLLAEGLLTPEQHQALADKGDYERRNILDYLDPEKTYMIGGKKITVRDSGIQSLSDEGSTRIAETNSMMLMQEVLARTEARIMANRANKALYELAKAQPDNGIVTENKIIRTTKDGKPVYAKAPLGFEKISAMIDGQPKEMLMPAELAREWIKSDPMVTQQWKNIMGWSLGANILRPFATGYNPFFAFTNIARDIIHAWTVTTEGGWSPFIPFAIPQMARDYAAVAGDCFSRTGRYSDYIMEGGGMAFLVHQGRAREGAAPGTIWSSLENLMGYAGETSELWTRLALRERALRNGYAPHEATWISRNYLDFNQGGSFSKAADAGIPYLNAGIQATRGIFRSVKDSPVVTGFKFAQMGLIATGLYLYNRQDKEFYNSVSPRDKANGLNFRLPFLPSFIDERGEKRYYYLHIPLDQGQMIASRVFEAAAQKYLGDPVDVDSVVAAAEQFSSLSLSSLTPPTLDAAINMMGNYDIWTMEDVWRGPEVQPWREFGSKTAPAAVKVGKALNISPTRLEAAVQQFVTSDNPFAEITGWALNQLAEKLPEQERNKMVSQTLKAAPGIRRFLRMTDPYHAFRETNEEISTQLNTERYTRSMELDAISDQIAGGTKTRADGMAYIMQQPTEERTRLVARMKRYLAWYEIPDRSWWVDLSESIPEAAAAKYWYRYRQLDKDQQRAFEKTLFSLHDPKLANERFMMKLNQLKKADE